MLKFFRSNQHVERVETEDVETNFLRLNIRSIICRDAVMLTFYGGYKEELDLAADDIIQIQKLAEERESY